MPHVLIKIAAGRSAAQKTKLAELVAQAVVAGANCTENQVSVSIEDIEAARWVDDVYRPEILGKPDLLFKKPGYDPSDQQRSRSGDGNWCRRKNL